MAWKDPRNCITLPFWRTVAGPPVAAVFVYRDPVEVAGSLHVREGIGVTYGLALWDRYVRSACANLVGLPTMVADYARMLDEPAAWIRELEDFLRPLAGRRPPTPARAPGPPVGSVGQPARDRCSPAAARRLASVLECSGSRTRTALGR
jgi:hypothetical protein